jgi:hypothetical protein
MASNKYIPPALRNKAPTPAPTANEFPALNSSRSSVSNGVWKNKTSFAVLASEWREHAEEETVRRELQEAAEKREQEKRAAEERMFVPRKRPVDDIYDYEEDEDDEMALSPETTEDAGWTTIERKPRKELSIDEKIARQLKQEEEEKRAQMERDSVWDASGNTDWDYRDRRAVA